MKYKKKEKLPCWFLKFTCEHNWSLKFLASVNYFPLDDIGLHSIEFVNGFKGKLLS